MSGFIKFMRTQDALDLMTGHHKEFILLSIIATRTRYSGSKCNDLERGQCVIGDYSSMGFSRQSYRTALKNLEKWNFLTTKPTTRGTVITLVNTDVFDPLDSDLTNKPTNGQPTANQQLTTNKEGKKGKKERINKEGLEKRFKKPSVEEVESYASSISFELDGQSFLDFYESKGWMIGKNKMKDWKAAVRTWKKRQAERNPALEKRGAAGLNISIRRKAQ